MTPTTPIVPSCCVFLVNFYLCGSIRAGIQSAHAISKLHMAYPPTHPAFPTIRDWDGGEPYMHLYNAGEDADLERSAQAIEAINRELAISPNEYLPGGVPFARFHESQSALRGTLTSVAMILPDVLGNLRDEYGDLPKEFSEILSKSRRRRAEAAVERTDLPLSWRLGLLFQGLSFA